MTGLLAPTTQRAASNERPSRPAELQHYPTLKKSLSASLSLSSRSPSRSPGPVDKDGSPSVRGQEHEQPRPPEATTSCQPLSLGIPKQAPAAEAAFKALQYLPTPLLVLSSIKTIVLANEAMGRLLGLGAYGGSAETQDDNIEQENPTVDLLLGQSLSQIGVDMLQAGQRIWISWEVIDPLTMELRSCAKESFRNSSTAWLKRWSPTRLVVKRTKYPGPQV